MQFTEHDSTQAKIVAGLLNAAKFDLSARQVLEGAAAIRWFSELMKKIEENIFEITKVIEPAPEPTAPEKPAKKGK